MLYLFLNGMFHLFHVVIIIFVMIGWLIPELRVAHFALISLTLGSWFILGRWLGFGYCPITDWHWKIKDILGEGRPNGSYIHLLLQNMARRDLNSAVIDKVVLIGTVLIAGLSLIANLGTQLQII